MLKEAEGAKPNSLALTLTEVQRQELAAIRDHDEGAYLREKAAGLLKIAEGWSGLAGAQYGLLKRRDADTVYRWVARYAEGRGRKAVLLEVVRQSPAQSGQSHQNSKR